jgi:hypothetical protein
MQANSPQAMLILSPLGGLALAISALCAKYVWHPPPPANPPYYLHNVTLFLTGPYQS